MDIKVYPYKQGSKSARFLALSLGGRVLMREGSRWSPRSRDIVVNWGASGVPDFPCRVLNRDVSAVSNKLSFFRAHAGQDYLPAFWENKEEIPDDVYPIVCRNVLAGHSGAGIHVAFQPSDLSDCHLYVRYVKKMDEYRVHLTRLGVFLVQRKARRLSHENPDWMVRNHQNGFVYARDVEPPSQVLSAASSAFSLSALDFGAVDVIFNRHSDRAYVLEINTAPGLEGTTVSDYREAISGLIENSC